MALYDRDYDPVHLALNRVGGSRVARMNSVADTLWRFFKDFGVNWVGFYTKDPDADQMILGPARDKPACSPIEMRGACGMCFTKKRPIVVHDVHSLGANYIACDPKDRSEVIVPLFNESGSCYGVLDVDSFERSAFGEADVRSLKRLMEATAISWPKPWVNPLYY